MANRDKVRFCRSRWSGRARQTAVAAFCPFGAKVRIFGIVVALGLHRCWVAKKPRGERRQEKTLIQGEALRGFPANFASVLCSRASKVSFCGSGLVTSGVFPALAAIIRGQQPGEGEGIRDLAVFLPVQAGIGRPLRKGEPFREIRGHFFDATVRRCGSADVSLACKSALDGAGRLQLRGHLDCKGEGLRERPVPQGGTGRGQGKAKVRFFGRAGARPRRVVVPWSRVIGL